MIGDANQFEIDLSNWATKVVPTQFVTIHKTVTMQALDGVVMLSAVDTGYMRNNHQVGVNSTAATEYAADSTSAGASARSAAEASLAALKIGDTTHVFNPVEYSSYLEHGTPKMAPRPMYRPTIERIRAQFA